MKKEFKEIFSALLDSSNKESAELANELFPNGIDKLKISDLKYRILQPAKRLVEGILKNKFGNVNYELEFLIVNIDFVEHHFRHWIEKIEGSACCADKSRYLINSLINFYTEQKEITHDYTQEYTYQIPEIIFKTHSEIVDFYDSLRDLFYGNSNKYILMLKSFSDAKYKEISELKSKHRFINAVKENNLVGWYIPKNMNLQTEMQKEIDYVKRLIENDTENKFPSEITSLYI